MNSRERILRAWDLPQSDISPLLGRKGFTLPRISELEWLPVGDPGADNWLVIVRGASSGDHPEIEIRPDSVGNVVVCGPGSKLRGRVVVRGRQHLLVCAGGNPEPVRANTYISGKSTVTFLGGGMTCVGAFLFVQGDRVSLVIGEGCMFSHGVVLRTSDEHAIFDLDTGAQVNPAGSITVEPYVWVGPEVHILKGVRVGLGAIIGERSLVTSDVGRCVLVGGVPARLLRERVSWDRQPIPRAGIHHTIKDMLRDHC